MSEVLVTLTILGILASIIVPNVIQQYQKRVTVTKLQKAYAEVTKLASNMAVSSGCVGRDMSCLDVVKTDDLTSNGFFEIEPTQEIYNLAGFKDAKLEKKILVYSHLSCEKDNSCDKPYGTFSAVFIKPSHNQYSLVFKTGKRTGFVNPCANVAQEKVSIDYLPVLVLTEPNKTKYIYGRNMFLLLIHNNFEVSPSLLTDYGKNCPLGTNPKNNKVYIDKSCKIDAANTGDIPGLSCYAKIISDGWKINY